MKNEINGKITLKYTLPTSKDLVLNLDLDKVINPEVYKTSRELHDIYERDYLFIPKKCDSVLEYLKEEYDAEKVARGIAVRQGLENNVFNYIESILDEYSFDCTYEELVGFFEGIIENENKCLASNTADPTLQLIVDSPNKNIHLKKLIIQLAIEFISEGSGMSSYVGGSFGKVQSDLFQIIIDEMGGGEFKHKHSHLYEGVMSSLNLSDETKFYRDYFDTGTFTVMNYVYYICQNKRFFFRFVGSLFRNEACFVNFQKQFGDVMEEAFGSSVDRRYFDVHSVVDQDHSNWALDNLVKTAIDSFGQEVIPEIVRGFISYKLYQELNDMELCYGIKAYDSLKEIQNQPCSNKSAILEIKSGEREYIVYGKAVVVEASGEANVTIIHDLSQVDLKEGDKYIVPPYFPVWVAAIDSEVSVSEIVG